MSQTAPPDPQAQEPLFTARLTAITAEGAKLGLQLNDVLLAVNGVPFAHAKADLPARLSRLVSGRAVLTFRRDDRDVNVVAITPALGAWDPEPAPENIEKKRISPSMLINWEIMTTDDDVYDLQPLTPSLLALLAAPLWLAQMRLWIPMATIASVTIITLPFGWMLASAIYGLASVYVWRTSQQLFRTDRLAKGYQAYTIVAAPNEASVHKLIEAQSPDLNYVYAVKTPGEKPGE